MTKEWPNPIPNPGSKAAIDLGCTCPILDNRHGNGYGVHPEWGVMFVYSGNCPLHGQKTEKDNASSQK